MNETFNCKICGWQNLRVAHRGAVDCIQQYRLLVDELRSLLPKGEQVMCASIARDSMVRIWIEGLVTQEGLGRLKAYIEFMQEAYGPDPLPATPSETESDGAAC